MAQYKHVPELENLNNYSEKQRIKDAFNNLKSFYRNTLTLKPEVYVFRSRIGKSELDPKSYSELSYNPFKENIGIGRANPKGHQVFYGNTHLDFSEETQAKSMFTSIKETSNIFRSSSKMNAYELGCLSRWRLTKELKVFTMFNYNFGKSTDSLIVDYRNQFNTMIDEKSKQLF